MQGAAGRARAGSGPTAGRADEPGAGSGRGRYHHGDLRRALVEAARTMLEEGGAELSLREVARRAGVSHAAPYRHFPSLAALLDAVSVAVLDELTTRLRQAAAGHTGAEAGTADAAEEALRRVGAGYLRFVTDQPAEARLVFSQPKSTRPPDSAVTAAAHRAFAVLVEVIRAGQTTGAFRSADPETLATTTWALLHGLGTLTTAGQLPPAPSPTAASTPDPAHDHLGVLLAGLRA